MRTRFALLTALALVALGLHQVRAEDYDDTLDPIEVVLEEDLDLDDADDDSIMPYRRDDWRGPGRHRSGWNDDWRGGPARDHRMGGPRGMRHDRTGEKGMHHSRGGRHGMGMRGGMGMIGPRAIARLNLTEDQKNKLVDILTENFRARLKIRMETMEAQNNLRTLRRTDASDHDAIIAANAALGSARGKMDVESRKLRSAVRAILTPEQIEKLDEMHDYLGRRHGDRGPLGKRHPKGGIRQGSIGRPAPQAARN